MIKTPFYLLATTFCLLYNISFSQCNVTVVPSIPPSINCGEEITLMAYGTNSGSGLYVDFNNGAISPGWTNSSPVNYSNPCGPTLDGTPALWFGNVGFPRTLTSVGYDFSCGGQVCFDLDFADDDPCGCSDCEDPDLINEGVYFQYSVDGGATWVDIFYFEPNSNGTGPYYSWANYCFNVPPGAFSTNTMFRWHQDDPTSAINDHWGIDNILLLPNVCGGGYYYEWNNVLGDQDTTVYLNDTTVFDVLFTNGVDDSCNTSIQIDVAPLNINVTTPNPFPACGQCININASLSPVPNITNPNYNTTWSPMTYVTNQSGMTITTCPGDDIVYTATVTETNSGCTAVDSVELFVFALNPGFNYPQYDFCITDAPTLPNITGQPGGDFSFGPAGLAFDIQTGEIDPANSTPGSYTITYAPNPPCPIDSTVTITIYDVPIVDAGPDSSICNGQPITLSGSGATNYTWDNGVTDGVAFSPSATNIYTVTGTDNNGCSSTDQVTVTIIPQDDASFNYPNGSEYCLNDANPVPTITGTPGGVFDWQMISGGPNFTITNSTGEIDLSATDPGSYEVSYTTSGACSDSSSVIVVVHDFPDASFTADVQIGCEPTDVTFNENNPAPSQICFWDFGNGITSNSCGPVTTTYAAGIYDVTLTLTSEAGCISTETYTDYIDITAQPTALFSPSPPSATTENTEIEFNNFSSNADSYYWTFGVDTASSSLFEPNYVFPEIPNDYLVTLTVYSDDMLCTDSTSGYITINDVLTFYVPNSITANGDGVNDLFIPVITSGINPEKYHLSIYNRWGELVFESYDTTVGWDATYLNGIIVPEGVYVWQITYSSIYTDLPETVRGHVTVLK